MIPHISPAGRSFRGIHQYLMHDQSASTNHRVAWTSTENMMTRCPDKAWKVMSYTAKHQDQLKEASGMSRAGRKMEKPVLHFSLSWHPEQTPDKDEMLNAARRAIAAIEMSDHEALIVAHRDTKHPHVHVVINRIHPMTGRAAVNSHTKRKLSAFAHQLELENGKIYCNQRKENLEMQANGKQTRYRDPIIQNTWEQSRSGTEFIEQLRLAGYTLARGRKRLVVIARGKALNPLRHLENTSAKEFAIRLGDVDVSALPDADYLNAKTPNESKMPDHHKEFEIAAEALRQQQANERQRLTHDFNNLIAATRERLNDKFNIVARQSEISRLETKCLKPVWWRHCLGLARRDREKLSRLRPAFKNVQSKIDEQITQLEKRYDTALSELQGRHEQQLRDLPHSLSCAIRDMDGSQDQYSHSPRSLNAAKPASP